jgi:hypothetical protein
MDYIYLPCVEHIKSKAALFTDNNIKAPAHFDRYKGQYINPELHQPYACPAIFFKFRILWEDMGNNTQKGTVEMEVHIELENYYESADGSPDQSNALEDYEFVRLVHFCLQGFQTANFKALKRRATEEDENPATTNVTILRYESTVLDESTDKYKDYLVHPLDDLDLTKKPLGTPAAPSINDDYHI